MFSGPGGLTPNHLAKKSYEPLGRDDSTPSHSLGFLLLGEGIWIAFNLRENYLKISAATAKDLERDACSCQSSQVQQ